MKTRLGCLTIPAVIVVVISMLVFGGITLLRGGVLFTPGALNAQKGTQPIGGVYSHAELSTNCASCHPAPWQSDTISDRCIACHKDVGQDPNNFHLAIVDKNVGCRGCHVDHRGATESLTIMDSKLFPHEKVGYSLIGHARTANGSAFACSDCHREKTSVFNIDVCATCHSQIDASYMVNHIAAFGQSCLACHDGVDIYGKGKFDHNKVAFILIGKHTTTVCSGCHAGETTSEQLKATAQDCFSCHQKNDPHLGRMGQDCASCHSPADWKQSTFDHSKLAFPLEGKHQTVSCQDCHLDTNLKQTPQDCFSCHGKQDPHQGSLGQDCASCHTPVDWTQVHFDHSTTNFPLLGKHFAVACQLCHTNSLFKNTPTDCYNCHKDQDVHQGQLGTVCANCHTPVDWTVVNFNHSTVAFTLTGKHASLACKDCHQDNLFKNTPQDCYSCHSKDDPHQGQLGQNCGACHTTDGWTNVNFDHSTAPFQLLGKHASVACNACHTDNLFKNTPTNCYACHAKDDSHQGQLGQNCAACHTPIDWTQSTFDHSQASFQLTGKHLSVSCASCHPGGKYIGVPTNCYGCHAKDDQHNGQFGTDCATCHTTTGWAQVSFDHSNTSFLLTGKHIGVNCLSCHVNGIFKGTPKDCYSCHAKDDNHNGQFGTDCGACHDTSGWQNATFDHSKTGFPLTGQHVGVNCTSCHPGGQFKGTPKDCYSCHAKDDNHNGQLGTDCAACHDTSGWQNATFDHSKSSFPLTGKHIGVNCASCHPGGRYRGTPTDCYSCHAKDDAHNGQFGTNCAACHNTSGWPNASFDHSKTSFPLVGKHTTVACTACHINGQYKGTPKDCYSCHAKDDAHSGQYGTDCGVCHDPNGWSPAHFDHSIFPLTGAHASLPCADCHPNGRFKGTPTACSACHADPAYHAGLFGAACGNCHTTNTWRPAQFNGSHTFPMNHGRSNNTCHTCHTTKLAQYTCYSCHDQNEIRNTHIDHGIPNFDNCIQCHPDGHTHDSLAAFSQQYVLLFNWLNLVWGTNWY